MPKLLLFAPCERVIIEQGANTVSLISVIQELTVAVPSDVPANAAAPQRWYVIAMWQRDEKETAQRFEQRLVVENPKGEHLLELLTPFELSKETHRNIGAIDGFPISIAGRYTLRLSVRQAGRSDTKWEEIADYPVKLIHTTVASARTLA